MNALWSLHSLIAVRNKVYLQHLLLHSDSRSVTDSVYWESFTEAHDNYSSSYQQVVVYRKSAAAMSVVTWIIVTGIDFHIIKQRNEYNIDCAIFVIIHFQDHLLHYTNRSKFIMEPNEQPEASRRNNTISIPLVKSYSPSNVHQSDERLFDLWMMECYIISSILP